MIVFSALSYKHCAFLIAGILYAFLGSPTPDAPGIAELLIGLCLIIAVGPQGIRTCFLSSCPHNLSPIIQTGRALLIYGLSLPIIFALIHGHDLQLMIRDLLPFIFLLLPLFFYDHSEHESFPYFCLYIIMLIGITFSIRSVLDGAEVLRLILSSSAHTKELTYLANSPAVLFTGLFFLGIGAKCFTALTTKRIFISIAFLSIAALCFIPLAMTIQRASLGYIIFALTAFALIGLYYRPRQTLLGLCFIFIAIFFFWDSALHILFNAVQKTSLVGFNARFEELNAVWEHISASPWALLFGAGWGGTYHSPAVGGLEVNFTHSLLSSMLLKTGLTGLLLTSIYIAALGQRLTKLVFSAPIFVIAALGPLVIPTFLYASYKSLDFGLLLLLICVYTPMIETRSTVR